MTRWRTTAAGLALIAAAVLVAPMMAGAATPTDNGVENLGWVTEQRNHFGNPARGFVIGEQWDERDLDGLDAGMVRGCGRFFKVSQTRRIALQVKVVDVETNAILQASASVNSGDSAPLVTVCTAKIDEPENPYFVEATATIRWADNTLTQGASFATTVIE